MICIIIFTVLGLGSTTICVIKLLDRCFPNDKIFKDLDIEDLYNVEKSVNLDDEKDFEPPKQHGKPKSIGLITRIENFDRDFLQRLLRKEGWEEDDPAFYDNFDRNLPINIDNSLEERFSAVMNKTNKGGDLSPYRNSIMHK